MAQGRCFIAPQPVILPRRKTHIAVYLLRIMLRHGFFKSPRRESRSGKRPANVIHYSLRCLFNAADVWYVVCCFISSSSQFLTAFYAQYILPRWCPSPAALTDRRIPSSAKNVNRCVSRCLPQITMKKHTVIVCLSPPLSAVVTGNRPPPLPSSIVIRLPLWLLSRCCFCMYSLCSVINMSLSSFADDSSMTLPYRSPLE